MNAVLDDLGTYPQWLGIVLSAMPDGDDAWLVEIGARVGPLRRAKRLRMARSEDGFVRAERDHKPHSEWRLRKSTSLRDVDSGKVGVEISLHYGGGLVLPGLDRILQGEVQRALPRLERLAREAN